jgi:hypothetical protein
MTATTDTSVLTLKQIKTLDMIIEKGREVKDEYPQIAEEYKKGLSLREIAELHAELMEKPANLHVARGIISYALTGYDGRYNKNYRTIDEKGNTVFFRISQEPYEGLIPPSEIKILGYKHKVAGGKKGGKIGGKISGKIWGPLTYKLGLGIHGASKEERSRWGKKGGRIAGEQAKKIGRGYCGLSLQERIKSGKKSAIRQGFVPYSSREEAVLLKLNQKYQDTQVGRYELIADILNRRFHKGKKIRTSKKLKMKIHKLKRKTDPSKIKTPIRYSDKEKTRLLELNTVYANVAGRYKLIANTLNTEFHGGKEIRSVSELRSKVYKLKRVK